MKRKKVLFNIAIVSVVIFICTNIFLNNNLTTRTYLPTEDYVRVIGRTSMIEDTLWLVHSGTGVEFSFKGTSATITMKGDSTVNESVDVQARVAIYVNDECVIDDMIDHEEEIYTIFESDKIQECTVKVVKLSEAMYSTVGISEIEVSSVREIEPTVAKERYIEFIGDSITCGYGVDDENKNHHFSTTTENITKTYAHKTSELLNADYSIIAVSGYGVISGFSKEGKKVEVNTIPQYYDKLGYSSKKYMGMLPADIKWNFAKEPDVIVLNLGTNDCKYTATDAQRQEEFIDGYMSFLQQIRQKNPNAVILCTLGIMRDELNESMIDAVERYKYETGDENIYSLEFDLQLLEDGYAADTHPTEATHAKAANKLCEKIKEIMSW